MGKKTIKIRDPRKQTKKKIKTRAQREKKKKRKKGREIKKRTIIRTMMERRMEHQPSLKLPVNVAALSPLRDASEWPSVRSWLYMAERDVITRPGNIGVNLSNSGVTTTARVFSAAVVKQAARRVRMGLSEITHSSLPPPLKPRVRMRSNGCT